MQTCAEILLIVISQGQYSGLVVGQKRASGRRQILSVLLRNGRVKEFSSEHVAFCIPGFASSASFRRFAKSDFQVDPTGEIMLDYPVSEYSRGVLGFIRTTQLEKGMAHKQLTKMYEHFIRNAENSNEAVTIKLTELAQFAFSCKQPTDEQLHATFLYLVTDNVHFTPVRNLLISQIWQLRSRNDVDKISRLVEWIRTRDGAYTGFLERARQLIEFYRAHADPKLGTFSRSALDMAEEYGSKLTATDKMFINFVVDWIKSPNVALESPHEVFVPTILKALKCYNTLFVDRSLAVAFLKEVGMFKPWDNISLVENANKVDEFLWSKKAKEAERTMEKYTNIFLRRSEVDSSTDFYARDPCDSIRHDFGNLPVYTIDDPTAKEIDDGLSIERIPGENAAWLHIHIADPSAYIPPSSELAKVMKQRVQTLYLPENHFPMIPDALSSSKLSLGTTAETRHDGSQYAMTFSTKLDDKGNIMLWKVRPSLVRKVHKLYYDDVDQLLSPHAPVRRDPHVDLTKTYSHPTSIASSMDNILGGDLSQETTVKEEFQRDIMDIFALVNSHAAFRQRQGALSFINPSPVVSIQPSPLDLPDIEFSAPKYVSQLPYIRVGLDRSLVSPARLMVAEAMIIGGRIVSQYAREHGVSIPFRTQTWPKNADAQSTKMRQELLQLRHPETGLVPYASMVQYMSILPPASVTMAAGLPHVLMGIPDGYTKATSPLRRYTDLVIHWQLKAHLLREKAPFSVDLLDTLCPRIEAREKQINVLMNKSVRFWVTELIRRLVAESHGEDMEWTCLVTNSNNVIRSDLGGTTESAVGTLLELGVRGKIVNLDRNLNVGEVIKVRIANIDPLAGHVDFAAI